MKTHSYAVLALVAVALAGLAIPYGQATHSPANKVAVAASTLDVLNAPLGAEGSSSTVETLLSGSMKTSSPTDLLLRVSLECTIWTNVTTVGNDDSRSAATVSVWIEIDGTPVGVNAADGTGGKVVFCDRSYQRVTSLFDDEDATIQTFLRTRSAHSFEWISLNTGSGEHDIVVKAQLDVQVAGTGGVQAVVGKRTLVAEPTRLANDVTV
ncbi:MAG TPA: hypothetical protein VI997_09750 [Candidatus Thermoplasmatota archaeon]|nr:hypothetical protein [Candidatus Thermoplasmatota archaeon]